MPTQPESQPANSFFGDLFKRVKSAFSRWREIRQLDSRDIGAVARDLNLSPSDFISLMFTSSCSLESLNRRLAYEGLSEEALVVSHPDELRDLRRVCSLCKEKGRCARDIRHGRLAGPSKYCPNELTLRSLARDVRHDREAQVLSVPSRRA